MSSVTSGKPATQVAEPNCPVTAADVLHCEFGRLRTSWWCFLLLGILLVVCGTVAIAFPAITSVAGMVTLGVVLMVAGIATIVTSLWAGKWSGLLLHLLIGILYLVAGYVITDKPLQSVVLMAAFVAALFIVGGVFRIVAAVAMRFPNWGWALLNGVVTFLCGMIIYRHFPYGTVWIIGLLVGLELLFHGWAWIMLSLAIRRIPAKAD